MDVHYCACPCIAKRSQIKGKQDIFKQRIVQQGIICDKDLRKDPVTILNSDTDKDP